MQEQRPGGNRVAGHDRERKAAQLIQEALTLLNQARFLLLVPGPPEGEDKAGEEKTGKTGERFPYRLNKPPRLQ